MMSMTISNTLWGATISWVVTRMSDHQQLLANFERLGLHNMREYYPVFMEQVDQADITLTSALLEMTDKELTFQADKKTERAIHRARFPKIKTFDAFEFDFQPSLNQKEILELRHLSFMDRCENIVFIGSPGVGKTHLAIALGIEACRQGKRTLFINCHELLLRLRTAYEKGTLERVLRRYAKYELLIIDEIGYLPIEKHEADLLFQLLNMRYETRSTIFTTNIALSGWGELFKSPETAAAILDRMIHHVKIYKITGQSYRMKRE